MGSILYLLAQFRNPQAVPLFFYNVLQKQLRLVLLCVNIVSYGTQTILAETARTRMEGAIRRLARWRAASWKNLPLSRSPRS